MNTLATTFAPLTRIRASLDRFAGPQSALCALILLIARAYLFYVFFRKENLVALREIALRETANRVHEEVESARLRRAAAVPWATRERLLVCVGPSPTSAKVIRAAKRLADRLDAEWLAVHVESARGARMSPADRERLHQNMRLAESLGAENVQISGDDVVVDRERRLLGTDGLEAIVELFKRDNPVSDAPTNPIESGVVLPSAHPVQKILVAGVLMNVFLGVFNLVPLPPLDGSWIASWGLPRSLGDTEYAIINGNFAISSGLKLTEAVALEKTPDHYLNVVAVKRADKDSAWAKDLVEVYRSKDFQAVVDSKFQGYAKPTFLQ